MAIDLDKIRKIYFIGIKGVAMSGLAIICRQRGLAVCGSDVADIFITDKILADNKIKVFSGFNENNLADRPDLVVIGTSWGDENPEVKAVKAAGIDYITDSELRGLLSKQKKTIAITGVHGKTTTTALLAFLFDQAGLQPSYLIGTGMVTDLKSNAGWFGGQHFIVEGDEYAKSKTDKTPKFADLDSSVSVITSLEWEHVDVYRDLLTMEKYFSELVKNTKESVVACGDWPSIKKIIAKQKEKTVTYGLHIGNDYLAYDIRPEFDQTLFKVRKGKEELGEFSIKLFGEHNVLNALAAIIVGANEGIDLDKIRTILPKFSGTQRRFEVKESKGIIFVDDYAHHPTEIKTTLKAVRSRYPDKIIYCVFQPHTVSRTKALLNDFVRSFSDADFVLFTDIYASAREVATDFTANDLAEETKKNHTNAIYTGSLEKTMAYLKDKIKPGQVVVTMGAGDVYLVRDKLFD
ncbi:MAG: UDP-N-acetylmuramate--L-alanine ligase [Candidatus Buchananbacteria bacterium]